MLTELWLPPSGGSRTERDRRPYGEVGGMFTAMIREIAPRFFTTDIQATLDYYRDKLGFECVSTWHDPVDKTQRA